MKFGSQFLSGSQEKFRVTNLGKSEHAGVVHFTTISIAKLKMGVTSFPAIRACIFDMDGLLINSEDIITFSTDQLLAKYGRPPFTRSIRVQLMGVPDSTNGDVFHNWAKLSIPREQWARELEERMHMRFAESRPLPGAEKLLSNLSRARSGSSGHKVELALASTSKTHPYELKTSSVESKRLLSIVRPDRRVLGDDPRVREGRGKPAPDMYLIALQSLNSTLDSGEEAIVPSECLVFEDSVAGVEAGQQAGMRVVWAPHPDVAAEFQTMNSAVLAERTGMIGLGDKWRLGETDDGWTEIIPSLVHFDYEKYGIHLSS